MSTTHPGKDGDPLPNGALIFRIGKNTHASPAAIEQRKALPAMFELSSEDKESPGQRLSIWAEELTIADQAWDFMGANPARTIVACLNVDKVRAIQAQPGFVPLQIEWEQALIDDGSGNERPSTRPGAAGHAGIAGLNQGGNGKIHSNQRKALRSALADIADISPVPVPHDIPEEHIRDAAYFVYQNQGPKDAQPEVHWIAAIRQLRRARVAQERKTNNAPY
jgi:hypothetical protein